MTRSVAFLWAIQCLNFVSGQIKVADVPECARTCLYIIAYIVTDECGPFDVRCLCNSAAFVGAFSCCLATNCTIADQAVAIIFNQEQCKTVNATAPAFVGCSPDGLVNDTKRLDLPIVTQAIATATNIQPTIIVSEIVTEAPTYASTAMTTVDFDGRPMLTSRCAVPYFVQALVPTGSVSLYPQVGCAAMRSYCCPYPVAANAVLLRCPQDYFTTLGGCCPFGYSVYGALFGRETPCFSVPSATLVPASTLSMTNSAVVTDYVFAKRFLLSSHAKRDYLPAGIIAGIVVASLVLLVAPAVFLWWRRQQGRPQAGQSPIFTTFPFTEPKLNDPAAIGHRQELANLEHAEIGAVTTSLAARGQKSWSFAAQSPPAYEKEKFRTFSLANIGPQELPGSIDMVRHPRAFGRLVTTGIATPRSNRRASPLTPEMLATGISIPDSLGTSSAISSAISPDLSPGGDRSPRNSPGFVISPLSSPKLRRRTP